MVSLSLSGQRPTICGAANASWSGCDGSCGVRASGRGPVRGRAAPRLLQAVVAQVGQFGRVALVRARRDAVPHRVLEVSGRQPALAEFPVGLGSPEVHFVLVGLQAQFALEVIDGAGPVAAVHGCTAEVEMLEGRYRLQLAAYGAALGAALGEPIVGGILVRCVADGSAEQIDITGWADAIAEVRAAVI